MSERTKNSRRSLPRIFAAPFAIGVASAAGLVAALVGDGAWDAIGWLGLGIPLIVAGWCLWQHRIAA